MYCFTELCIFVALNLWGETLLALNIKQKYDSTIQENGNGIVTFVGKLNDQYRS